MPIQTPVNQDTNKMAGPNQNEEYSFQEFPKWAYHKEKAPQGVLVKDRLEERRLGEGYVDSPAKFASR